MARRKAELFWEIVIRGLRGHAFMDERRDAAGGVCRNCDALLRRSAAPDNSKNAFPRQREADRSAGHAGSKDRQLVVGPHTAFATETPAHESRNHADIFLFQAEDFGETVGSADRELAGIIQGHFVVAIPCSNRRVRLYRVVIVGWSCESQIHSMGCRFESGIGIAFGYLRVFSKELVWLFGVGNRLFKRVHPPLGGISHIDKRGRVFGPVLRIGNHNRYRLPIPRNLIGVQNLDLSCARTTIAMYRKRFGNLHFRRIEMSDYLYYSGSVLRCVGVNILDNALRDRAIGDDRVHQINDIVLRGKLRRARDLDVTVEPIDWFAQIAMLVRESVALAVGHHVSHRVHGFLHDAHRAAPSPDASSESTSAMVRFASSILKALFLRGIAGANSAAAAAAKLSGVGALPRRKSSATEARHGLCETPPSARRISRMMPASTFNAAATET